jgi:3-oxoacyl-[acyl-carrier protein] reductase
MKLQNKVVIVTGASSGIGAATAIRFAKEGAIVAIVYKDNSEGAKKVLQEIETNGGKAGIFQGDVSQETVAMAIVQEVIKTYGRVDVLINNAGKYFDGDEWNRSSEAWQKTIETNLYSAINCTKYVGEHFLNVKKGVIVNIASRIGVLGDVEAITYGAAKAGIINITKAYAKGFAPHARVNCVSPGAVKTGYWLTADAQNYIEDERQAVPLGALVEIEDIVNAILFLSCDDSKMITGQNLIVDGGYSLK